MKFMKPIGIGWNREIKMNNHFSSQIFVKFCTSTNGKLVKQGDILKDQKVVLFSLLTIFQYIIRFFFHDADNKGLC